ncbi:SMC family ATPase [Candidatus Woesearchaeota archaeon]|nr:SMC family ATPase [Candidatus Woesearchaeota archaeon]
MLLKSITLHNIRSYNQQKITFPEGSILLSGDIGAGKSSILLAIEFALFGIQRDSLAGDMLLRKGASSGFVELDLQLGELNHTNLIIHRLLKRGNQGVKQDAGFIVVNGKRQDATPTELKSTIVDLLGYPKEMITKSTSLLYRYTVYTPQEEMKAILQEQKTTRLDTLRRLFHIDKYQRIANNTLIYGRSLREDCRELEGKISDLPQLLLQLNEFQETALRLSAQVREVEEQCHQQEAAAAERAKALAALEEKQQQHLLIQQQFQIEKSTLFQQQQALQDIEQQLTTLTNQLIHLDAALANYPASQSITFQELQQQITAEERQYTIMLQQRTQATTNLTASLSSSMELQQELTKKTSEHDRIAKEKKGIEEKIGFQETNSQKVVNTKVVSTKVANIQEPIEPIKVQEMAKIREALQETLQGLLLEKKGLEIQYHDAFHVQHSIASMDQCPTCLQSVAEGHKKSVLTIQAKKGGDILSKIRQYDHDIAELAHRIHHAEATVFFLSDYSRLVQQHQLLTQHLNILENDLYQLQQKKTRILNEQAVLQQILTTQPLSTPESQRALQEKKKLLTTIVERDAMLQSRHEKIQQENSLSQRKSLVQKEIASISSSLDHLSASLAAFSSLSELLPRARAQRDAAVDTLHQVQIRKATLSKELESIQLRKKEIEGHIAQKQAAQHRLVRLQQFFNWLDSAFIPLLSTIEKHVLGRVYHEFNALFQRWFSMLLGDEQLTARLDDSFSPVIEQNGHDMAVEGLSGGEKTAIALAYRLALNRVVNDIITTIKTKDIIILDEPTDGFSTEQLDLLRDVLLQLGTRQTIIVSHETKMEGFVDHVIRLQKEEHVTKVLNREIIPST